LPTARFFDILYEAMDKQISFNFKNIFIVAGFLLLVSVLVIVPSLYFGRIERSKNTEMPTISQELKIEDLTVGTGEEAKTGNKVTVNYLGTLLDGTKFDSSYDRKQPFAFNLGQGEVIAGWDRGVVGMKVGGKRKLTIPSDLAYGESGSGDVIPPNSTLVFEVELLKVE
jgi:FKBP-type peptidyl-prolyl cis-trans isomerase